MNRAVVVGAVLPHVQAYLDATARAQAAVSAAQVAVLCRCPECVVLALRSSSAAVLAVREAEGVAATIGSFLSTLHDADRRAVVHELIARLKEDAVCEPT